MTFVFINFTSWYSLQAINTVIAVIVMHTFIVLTDVLIEHLEKKWKARTNAKFDDEILIIAHNGAKILIIMIGILLILYVWGVEIKSMLLSLGVLGVVVGFALKDSLDNLAGGISLMLDRSFRTGDMVRLESGEIGSVVDIGLRSTRIKTLDSELLTVPNGQLANTKFVNYAKPNNMLRIKIPVAVEYGSDPDKVKKVLRKCARSFSMRKDETSIEVRFLKMADFSLEFELLFYIKTYKDRYKAVNKMTTKVYKELKKNKIGIPFPTRTIYMKNKRKR